MSLRRTASPAPPLKKDVSFRTSQHFTLKTDPLKRSDLDDFVPRYHTENRHKRKETERFKGLPYDDLVKRDKANLDISS